MYVIYDQTADNRIVEVKRHTRYYKTQSAAKAAITRASKKYQELAGTVPAGRLAKMEDYRIDKDPQFIYAVAEIKYYQANLEKFVERTDFMSGKKFMESVNTPHYCSPSSEAYWSM